MENGCTENESEYPSTGVFEIAGEPAILINGVPDLSQCEISKTVIDAESNRRLGCREWLEGREVRKLFGDQYFSGTVTNFDKESGWFRVVYEDGDFEDLEWHELEEVLQPLDITVPLKTLALKILRKSQKPIHKSKKTSGRGRNGKGKWIDPPEEVPVTKLDIGPV